MCVAREERRGAYLFDGEVTGRAVLEEAFVPLLDFRFRELRVHFEVLQNFGLQLRATLSHVLNGHPPNSRVMQENSWGCLREETRVLLGSSRLLSCPLFSLLKCE